MTAGNGVSPFGTELSTSVSRHEGEAEIIGMNGRVFSCRWRDYPHQGTFLRKPGELALMPPGEA